MKILVPVLCGKEVDAMFVDAITNKVDEIILLQIVDNEFHSRAGSAVSEVRQFRIILDELKKAIGHKRKKCLELTEWGSTIQKIISLALLRKVDKVFLVEQQNQFFQNILTELKKKKIAVEVIVVPDPVQVEKKKKGLW
ncbi:MAG: hypothetical protein WCI04_04955 [archaeon]